MPAWPQWPIHLFRLRTCQLSDLATREPAYALGGWNLTVGGECGKNTPVLRARKYRDEETRGRSVAVNMSACQAEDRGFDSRRPRWVVHYIPDYARHLLCRAFSFCPERSDPCAPARTIAKNEKRENRLAHPVSASLMWLRALCGFAVSLTPGESRAPVHPRRPRGSTKITTDTKVLAATSVPRAPCMIQISTAFQQPACSPVTSQ